MDRPAAWRAIAVDLEAERLFHVGEGTIDPVSREASYPAGVERLQPQPLKVLVALVRRSGQVVTRSELIDSCWGGRFVGEDVVNRAISTLRDFAERVGGFSIETVPKAGYRLVERQSRLPKAKSRWLVPAALLAAVGIGCWLSPRWIAPAPKPPLVALKPLTSSGDEASRDLAAATGDALSHMMTAGSFHGRLAWPASAADEADADLILSGDVRRTGNSFAALTQLRDRRTGTLLFSRRFQATSAEAELLPERIGAEVSSNLTGALALMVLDRGHSANPELTAEKLKSIGITVSGDDPLASYQISRRMGETHPEWVLSQLGVAYDTAFALSSLPRRERPEALRRARIAADKAQAMAPDFGDTYVPWCLLRPVDHARECEDRLLAGMRADPDAPFTPFFLSSLLFNAGRFDEALQFARTALAGDPFHPHKLRIVIRTLIVLGQKEEAEALFAKAARWWPNHQDIYWDRLHAYSLVGDLDGAGQSLREMPPQILPRPKQDISAMLRAYRDRDAPRLRAICFDPDAGYLLESFCLTALNGINDRASAMRLAQRLFSPATGSSARETEGIWLDDPHIGMEPLLSAPATAWLRADPHFPIFAKQGGNLAYWGKDRLPDFCRGRPEPFCKTLGATQ